MMDFSFKDQPDLHINKNDTVADKIKEAPTRDPRDLMATDNYIARKITETIKNEMGNYIRSATKATR